MQEKKDQKLLFIILYYGGTKVLLLQHYTKILLSRSGIIADYSQAAE